jgi:choline kinase
MAYSNNSIGIILAAGRGSRLKELSLEQPKPMVRVNSETIISNLVRLLVDEGLKHIVVMVGYHAEKIKEHLAPFRNQTQLTFIENPDYDKTNNIYTLWLARDYLKNGFYLFEADVYIEQTIVHDFLHYPHDNNMLVDRFQSFMNGTVVTFDEQYKVKAMLLKSDQTQSVNLAETYKTVNFYRISANHAQHFFLPKLDEYIAKQITGSYYELIIKEAIQAGQTFYALPTGNRKWYEIDTQEDLVAAENMFKA